MSKHIFLTGANGFLGSYLARDLALDGWNVKCLLRSQKGESANERLHKAISRICNDASQTDEVLERCSVIEGDLDKPQFGLTQIDYDHLANNLDSILHCAAMTTFDPAHAEQQWKVNVEGTEQVCRLAVDCNPPYGYHYISTAYVAGNRTDTVFENDLDQGQLFFNSYESSKFEAEKIINRFREQGLATTVYRPSIIVGDSHTGQTTLFHNMYIFLRFFDSVLRAFDEKDSRGRVITPVRIIGNLAATKNVVHVDYVADTTMAIFKNTDAHGGTYHLTHDNPPALSLITEAMEEVLGVTGVRLVDEGDFEKTPPTDMEKFVLNQNALHAQYLTMEPIFDRSALKKILPTEKIPPCPPMDKEALMKLFKYALDSKWGRLKK